MPGMQIGQDPFTLYLAALRQQGQQRQGGMGQGPMPMQPRPLLQEGGQHQAASPFGGMNPAAMKGLGSLFSKPGMAPVSSPFSFGAGGYTGQGPFMAQQAPYTYGAGGYMGQGPFIPQGEGQGAMASGGLLGGSGGLGGLLRMFG